MTEDGGRILLRACGGYGWTRDGGRRGRESGKGRGSMDRSEIEAIAREEAQQAALGLGNTLPITVPFGGAFAGMRGDEGGWVSFPQRACDPFFWRWNTDTEKVTVGNVIFYKVDGTWVGAADAELTMAEGVNYVYAVFSHTAGTLTVETTATEATAITADADRTAGNQKMMLYKFTKTGTGLKCDLDRIHHSAVGTNFW